MRKILAFALGLALVAGWLGAESGYVSLSATSTSQTHTFDAARAAVSICNDGTGVAYYRLLNDNDLQGSASFAATTSSSKLPVGVCIEYSKPVTEPAFYRAVSVVTNGADTATVRVYSD